MKYRANFLSIIALLFVLVLLSSCNGKLSRSKAEDLIIKKYKLPDNQVIKFARFYFKKSWGDRGGFLNMEQVCLTLDENRYEGSKDMLDYFLGNGLITIKDTEEYYDRCHTIYAKVTLSNEGMKYMVKQSVGEYEIKVCDLVFDKINGISEEEKSNLAEAEFTLRRENFTPFGKYYFKEEQNTDNKKINKKDVFKKYDDGWRIEN